MIFRLRAAYWAPIIWLVGSSVCAQEADYIPPIYPVETFAKQPTMRSPTLSPNGELVAYITTQFNGRKSVFAHPIAGIEDGKTMILPYYDNADIMFTRWANNDVLLTAYSYTGGNFLYRGMTTEQSRLIAATFDGEALNLVKPSKRQTKLFRDFENRKPVTFSYIASQANIVDMLPDDPDHILLGLEDDLDGDIDIRKINLHTADYTIEQWGRKDMYSWLTDENHKPALSFSDYGDDPKLYIADHKRDLWSYEGIYALLEKEIYPTTILSDGKTALFSARNAQGNKGLCEVDLTSGSIVRWLFSHESYDLEGLYRSDITNKIIGTGYIDTAYRQVFMDGLEKRILRSVNKSLPNAHNQLLSSDKSGNRWLVYSFTQGATPKIFYLDWTARQLLELADLYADLNDRDVAQVSMEKLVTRDGLEIEVYITTPVGRSGPLPTILLPHGGPWSRDYIRFDPWAQFFANRGYRVLQPNFRGSDGYGKAFEDLGKQAWGLSMQDDLTDTVKWAIAQSLTQAERVCIVGGSYGGYAALMGVVKTPDLFQCAIALNGVADLPLLWNDERDFLWYREMREEIGENRRDLKTISPYHRAEEISKPVLLIAAKDDSRINYKHSKKMYKKLKKLKKPVKYIELKSGGHSVDVDAERVKMFKAMGKFVEDAIGGG